MTARQSSATAGGAGGRRCLASEELEPCADGERVEAYVGEVADIDGAARPGREARRRNCYGEAHVEASELRAAVIKHKHHPGPEGGDRHLHAEAPNNAIPIRGVIDRACRVCRARAESGASNSKSVVVARRVRERALDLGAGPTHGGVGHEACIAQWNHET